ncbi:unnamed protein product [Closterium sp. NIES-65]|nr:unnamed protein product [Closterium sp. NIES-65]
MTGSKPSSRGRDAVEEDNEGEHVDNSREGAITLRKSGRKRRRRVRIGEEESQSGEDAPERDSGDGGETTARDSSTCHDETTGLGASTYEAHGLNNDDEGPDGPNDAEDEDARDVEDDEEATNEDGDDEDSDEDANDEYGEEVDDEVQEEDEQEEEQEDEQEEDQEEDEQEEDQEEDEQEEDEQEDEQEENEQEEEDEEEQEEEQEEEYEEEHEKEHVEEREEEQETEQENQGGREEEQQERGEHETEAEPGNNDAECDMDPNSREEEAVAEERARQRGRMLPISMLGGKVVMADGKKLTTHSGKGPEQPKKREMKHAARGEKKERGAAAVQELYKGAVREGGLVKKSGGGVLAWLDDPNVSVFCMDKGKGSKTLHVPGREVGNKCGKGARTEGKNEKGAIGCKGTSQRQEGRGMGGGGTGGVKAGAMGGVMAEGVGGVKGEGMDGKAVAVGRCKAGGMSGGKAEGLGGGNGGGMGGGQAGGMGASQARGVGGAGPSGTCTARDSTWVEFGSCKEGAAVLCSESQLKRMKGAASKTDLVALEARLLTAINNKFGGGGAVIAMMTDPNAEAGGDDAPASSSFTNPAKPAPAKSAPASPFAIAKDVVAKGVSDFEDFGMYNPKSYNIPPPSPPLLLPPPPLKPSSFCPPFTHLHPSSSTHHPCPS